MQTYRKTNQWSSHSRDLIESIRRFYSNSFVDAQRQEAINLFLGNYTITKGQPTLWELTTDYYLHHIDPQFAEEKPRRYIQPFCPFSDEVTSNGGMQTNLTTQNPRLLVLLAVSLNKTPRPMKSCRMRCGRNITVPSLSPRCRKYSHTI